MRPLTLVLTREPTHNVATEANAIPAVECKTEVGSTPAHGGVRCLVASTCDGRHEGIGGLRRVQEEEDFHLCPLLKKMS